MSNQWEKTTETIIRRESVHIWNALVSERKKMISIFKATEVWKKCWKINLFSKEQARLIMHLLVPLALFGYHIDALIFMHMQYIFFSYMEKYGVDKKKEMSYFL